MAKKPTEKEPIVFTSGLLRHVNKQTMGADATTEVAEAIATPGVAEGVRGGMYIEGLLFHPSYLARTYDMTISVSSHWSTQIQLGDRSETPVTLEPDSPWLFASLLNVWAVATQGIGREAFPMNVPVLRPEPVIVTSKFTVVHHGTNQAWHNSEVVYVDILYRTCILHPDVRGRMLEDQARTS